MNISHPQSPTDRTCEHTDAPSWPHKQTQGHERHRRSLLGLALARLSPVNQEKLAHPVAHCNTHKASRSWLFMPLNLALKIKLPSCAVIVDIVEIIYANFSESEPVNTNGEWRRELQPPGGGDAGGSVWPDIKDKIPLLLFAYNIKPVILSTFEELRAFCKEVLQVILQPYRCLYALHISRKAWQLYFRGLTPTSGSR